MDRPRSDEPGPAVGLEAGTCGLDGDIPLPDPELKAGMKVGDYEIQGRLGQGGMGAVYSAVHPLIGKKAAIKVISPRLCQDPTSVSRFIQEARSVNRIGHPNIVDVFTLGQLEDGRSYYIMEWLQGESLAERMQRGRIPFGDGVDILLQIADALEAVHDKQIIHRDLKPENIFLVEIKGQRPQVKLLDFGIAKLAPEAGVLPQTGTGIMLGTPGYMSPEQARGRHLDHRADLYALGTIAYEVLLDRSPFRADNPMDLLLRHCTEPAPSPRALWPEIPAELADLMEGLVAKKARLRPTIAEIRAVLRSLPDVMTGPITIATPTPADALFPPFAITGNNTATTITEFAATATSGQATTTSGQVIATRPVISPQGAGWPKLAGAAALIAASVVAAVLSLDTSSQAAPAPPRSLQAAKPVSPLEAPEAPAPATAPKPSAAIAVTVNTKSAILLLDGVEVASRTGSARIPVDDPGEHSLEVRAEGFIPKRRTITVRDGVEVVIDIELDPVAKEPVTPEPKPKPAAKRTRRAKPTSTQKRNPRRGHKRLRGGDYTLDPFGG